MGNAFGIHRTNNAEVIRLLSNMWKQIGNHQTGFAVWLEFPRRREYPLRRATFSRVGDERIIEGNLLTAEFLQFGFVIKTIDLADPTLHKQKDHSFEFGRQIENGRMRWQLFSKVCHAASVALQHALPMPKGENRSPYSAATAVAIMERR
jgi:hypothetical protein